MNGRKIQLWTTYKKLTFSLKYTVTHRMVRGLSVTAILLHPKMQMFTKMYFKYHYYIMINWLNSSRIGNNRYESNIRDINMLRKH